MNFKNTLFLIFILFKVDQNYLMRDIGSDWPEIAGHLEYSRR